jgi:hypothetical protein
VRNFGTFGVGLYYLRSLLILAAIVPALWISKKGELYFARRKARRALEEGWLTWTAQKATKKSLPIAKAAAIGKKVA